MLWFIWIIRDRDAFNISCTRACVCVRVCVYLYEFLGNFNIFCIERTNNISFACSFISLFYFVVVVIAAVVILRRFFPLSFTHDSFVCEKYVNSLTWVSIKRIWALVCMQENWNIYIIEWLRGNQGYKKDSEYINTDFFLLLITGEKRRAHSLVIILHENFSAIDKRTHTDTHMRQYISPFLCCTTDLIWGEGIAYEK